MRRLLRILGLAAALSGGAVLVACAFFHGDYPPSSGECKKTSDCLFDEACSDAGVCVAAPQSDAAVQEDASDDGGGQ